MLGSDRVELELIPQFLTQANSSLSNVVAPHVINLMGKEAGDDLWAQASEARKYVWMGAIPMLVDLHSSEITSLPAPSPFLVRIPIAQSSAHFAAVP